MFYHGDRVQKWLETKRTTPVLVEIDPTSVCNAHCPWCFYRSGAGMKAVYLDTDIAIRALGEMAECGVKAINWTGGGEPTLHPAFGKLTERAYAVGLKQGMFTNALLGSGWADAKLFDWIRVSFTDSYLERVDTEMLRCYADRTRLGFCLNLTRNNAILADELCQFAKSVGAAYFQTRPALEQNYEDQDVLDVPVQLKQHETDDFKVYLSEYKFRDCAKPRGYQTCYAGAFVPVVDYRGDVRTCNYHLDKPERAVGNLAEHSFSELVARLPYAQPVLPDCQNCCKNHELNLLLNELLAIQDTDFV